jgi:hypothetical protein
MASIKTRITGILAITGAFCAASLQADELIPYGASWSYLAPIGIDEDPNITDFDFDDTWFLPEYDTGSPIPWEDPSPEPIGYGDIAAFPNGLATILDTPESGDRYTAYFRHNFTTTTPESGLVLQLLADDGAKVYLDGAEILSYNCCEFAQFGDVAFYDEFASAVGNENGYSQLIEILPGETLSPGDHVLAVAVHQANATSSDLGFSLRFASDFVPPVEIMPMGGTFRYFEGFEEEPSDGTLDWTTPEFNDQNWSTGDEGFGYESGGAGGVTPLLNTPLDEMEGIYTSLYLRKKFTVDNPGQYSDLILNIDYDDGFFAYVNGVLVFSSIPDPDGDPTTGIPFDTFGGDIGANHESGNGAGAGEQFTISLQDFPGLLQPGGENVLAIHGLNTNLTSSDFVLAQIGLFGSLGGAGVPGDFNGNGVLDTADIDDLTGQSAGGTNPGGYDLTNDSLVNGDDISFWISDLYNSWIGDANLDGEFNTSDLVQVLASGTYEVDVDSVWSTGDFNGDGRTDTSDLVTALAGGGYEAGPKAAVAAVPEPGSLSLGLTLVSVGSLIWLPRRRVR